MTATDLARAVVDALLAGGVRHVVVAPGSRNAPLSLALYDAAAAGALTLHTRIDERSAAYLALGIARTSRRPAAVVTTSGTASANLHPAVLEAAHSHLPLVAVTADRPARLRGTLANQTTDQQQLYGDAAPYLDLASADDVAEVAFAGGPVHLNAQFDAPLLPVDRYQPPAADLTESRDTQRSDDLVLPSGPRTVVVAGDNAKPPARVLAEQAGWPLFAEPSSGARTGANAVRTYRLLLDTALADEIERVVVWGSPTLSRPVQRLLSRPDVDVFAQELPGRWRARPHPVSATFERAGIARAAGGDWLGRWREADAALAARIDAWVDDMPELSAYAVAAEVAAALPGGGLLFVGASNPIRDLDVMAPPYVVGERRMIVANRGLAGIDGTVSSAIGAALGRPHSTRAIAYVGDVTFLHDLNGLLIGPGEARPDLTLVVANDDGGSIFATLEQGAPAYAEQFEKVFGTPHHAGLADLCAGYGVPHRRCRSRAELAAALARPAKGIEVVEAVIGRAGRRELDAALRALARPR